MGKEEWLWAELNAFHSADIAKQLLEEINSFIVQAEYLRKKEQGQLDTNKFKDMFLSAVNKLKKE